MWRKNAKIDCRMILFSNTIDHVSCFIHEQQKSQNYLAKKNHGQSYYIPSNKSESILKMLGYFWRFVCYNRKIENKQAQFHNSKGSLWFIFSRQFRMLIPFKSVPFPRRRQHNLYSRAGGELGSSIELSTGILNPSHSLFQLFTSRQPS